MESPPVAVAPKPEQTLADRLCNGVLKTARAVDATARISSVARWEHDDSTLLSVSTDSGSPFQVADVLRRRWPLAAVSVVQDMINGNQQTQVLIPSGADQLRRANDMARESSAALWLSLLVRVLGAAAMICFSAMVVSNVLS
tara:strand:- start:29 stop:454 length:426 start_codon:yes stop_codon:yes gene_type:complete